MDSEQLQEMFQEYDECDNDFVEFDRIPESERLHPNAELCGMLKVWSLMIEPNEYEMEADHDIIYLPFAAKLKEISKDDVLYLARCGIFFNEEHGCLSMFT